MINKIDTLDFAETQRSNLSASWGKVNITPDYSMPMAGYKPRNAFKTVHDSLFVRFILLEVDGVKALLINTDLLIFPPRFKEVLTKKLDTRSGISFVYLSASHTHNGPGGWDDSILGGIVGGDFHEEWLESISEKVAHKILNINTSNASIEYWESTANELVRNRIAKTAGEVDGKLRGLTITKTDSSSATLFTYSAHPTSISKNSLALSGDYPSATIDLIERNKSDFAMFMSGMVGSHSFKKFEEDNFDLVDLEAKLLYQKIASSNHRQPQNSISISYKHIPMEFGPSQLRISEDWKVRDWVLKALFGGLRGELTYLRLGDIVMIGTPCDFSGEIFAREKLEDYASQYDKHLIITSFNGDYIGYITDDRHYDSIKNAETRELNWVGPYYGQYFTTMIKEIVRKDSNSF